MSTGADLLDAVEASIRRYVMLPSEDALVAVTLWTAATHALPHFEHATRLCIHSPEKRCGKSRLLEVIVGLSHTPMPTTNASVAALFRVIEKGEDQPPTLVIDEADRLFGSVKKDENNTDLIALLNNGFRKGTPTWRCVGPNQTPTPFSNYAMAAIAGIGNLPDTIEDRGVNITMRRRLPHEAVEKFRLRTDQPKLVALREQLHVWAQESNHLLSREVTTFPSGLDDRAEDAWEPLLTVAQAAGGHWPKKARRAASNLYKQHAAGAADLSDGTRLLRDIAVVWSLPAHRQADFLPTRDVVTALRAMEESPWMEIDLTARKLATRLAKFGISPGHDTAKTTRGWQRRHFTDAFARYVPPQNPSNPSDASEDAAEQPERPDGSQPPDGSTRPDATTRPDEAPGDSPSGRVGRVGHDPGRTDEAAVSGAQAVVPPQPSAPLASEWDEDFWGVLLDEGAPR